VRVAAAGRRVAGALTAAVVRVALASGRDADCLGLSLAYDVSRQAAVVADDGVARCRERVHRGVLVVVRRELKLCELELDDHLLKVDAFICE
jgi:hypothetical protein